LIVLTLVAKTKGAIRKKKPERTGQILKGSRTHLEALGGDVISWQPHRDPAISLERILLKEMAGWEPVFDPAISLKAQAPSS
jgi:hypothetical protein